MLTCELEDGAARVVAVERSRSARLQTSCSLAIQSNLTTKFPNPNYRDGNSVNCVT